VGIPAAFLRESKRLNFLINAHLRTGTEAHIIVQDEVTCKDTSKQAGIAPNREEEKRKEVSVCMGEEREQKIRQQNTYEHTPKKKLKGSSLI